MPLSSEASVGRRKKKGLDKHSEKDAGNMLHAREL